MCRLPERKFDSAVVVLKLFPGADLSEARRTTGIKVRLKPLDNHTPGDRTGLALHFLDGFIHEPANSNVVFCWAFSPL